MAPNIEPKHALCRALRLGLALIVGLGGGAIFGVAAAAEALLVDGVLDEPIWQSAQVFDDFRVTEPYTLGAPRLPTRALLASTPQGIAVGFELSHPAAIARVAERTARDADQPGDRVNVYLDLDGDGRVAYNFTVALSGSIQDATWTNETAYSSDWDGAWAAAVKVEEQRWWVEILIPWTVASMRDSSAPRRTVGILFDRFLAANQERSASASASFRQPRFVSDFPRIEITQYQSQLFEVFPYLTARHDVISAQTEFKGGADLFWKPSGDFQLSATLNPDFGQVEADELVVNFDAVEVFFSDKRAFFTENQGVFDVRTTDSGILVYTRRIGGPRDDGSGAAADIDAALKLNGSWRGVSYGTLAAVESDFADDLGAAYLAQRLVWPGEHLTLGWLSTLADRPALDRIAWVHGLDAQWRAGPDWLITGQLLASDISAAGADQRGQGAWLRAFWAPSTVWRHELELTHFDAGLDFNDLGFLRRASLNELEWTSTYTERDYADDHWLRASEWRIEPQLRFNDRGARLPPVVFIDRGMSLREGGELSWQAKLQGSGIDDLLSRGNGDVRLPTRHGFYAEYESPRIGAWQGEVSAWTYQEGLTGWGRELAVEASYVASESLALSAEIARSRSPDWLIWRGERTLGRFARDQASAALALNWFPAERHELRAKLEWVGLDADRPSALTFTNDGRIVPSEQPLAPFALNSLGVQLRYRWRFAEQSDFFAVYSRGGERFGARDRGDLGDLLLDAFDLRDADQVLLKVRWRL